MDKVNVADKDEGKAPPVPPKTTEPEGTPPVPPKTIHEDPSSQSQNSLSTHDPLTATHSVQSSTSEERYEIPDTSRAPPPRPPVSAPPSSQHQTKNGKTTTEYDRYEVPEDPKQPVVVAAKDGAGGVKAPEAEERYEIPAVVKETPVKRGVNGAVSRT